MPHSQHNDHIFLYPIDDSIVPEDDFPNVGRLCFWHDSSGSRERLKLSERTENINDEKTGVMR